MIERCMSTHTWPPRDPRFSALVAQERQHMAAGQYEQALAAFDEYYAVAVETPAPDGVLAMLWSRRGDILRRKGDLIGAELAYAESVRRLSAVAERTDSWSVVALPLHQLAAVCTLLGKYAEARAYLDRADRLCTQDAEPDRHRLVMSVTSILRGWAYALENAPDDATRHYDAAQQTLNARRTTGTGHFDAALARARAWLLDRNGTPELFLWDM
jgi:tetratricopeptide (TPR) repeat protein